MSKNPAKFEVEVKVSYLKKLSIFAEDEAEAKEKAVDVVLKWQNVSDAEATECEEI